jgi:RNA polymerase sigma factor (TIGR02999 family)
MSEITQVLDAVVRGDAQAARALLPLVYDELRRLAASHLALAAPGQTLEPTALVHEAYLRLVGPADQRRWTDRGHFFAAAAQAMRHLLVDRARHKGRGKRGGGRRRVELPDAAGPAPLADADDLLALDEALSRLADRDPDAAQVVQLRYFAGLSVDEAAQSLGISRRTVLRHWTFARAWLLLQLQGDDPA